MHWVSLKVVFALMCFAAVGYGQSRDTETRLTQADYIALYSHIAVKNMEAFGIPASITLAQGILESAAGNSNLARYANNHFGIKCHRGWQGGTYYQDDDARNECFRAYSSPEESFADHARFLTTRQRYASLFELDRTDYEGWARGLRAAGYATNPAYADRLINLIERHELYRFDHAISDTIAPGTQRPRVAERRTTQERTRRQQETTVEPSFSTGGLVIRQFNGIKYVTARQGETLQQLADALQLREWMLRRYNDLDREQEIQAGERVYIQSKKRRGSKPEHTFRDGDTLHSISQQYGIRLKHLLRYNNLEEDSVVTPGTVLRLRR